VREVNPEGFRVNEVHVLVADKSVAQSAQIRKDTADQFRGASSEEIGREELVHSEPLQGLLDEESLLTKEFENSA